MKTGYRIVTVLAFALFVFSCKKKSDPPATNTPISCSLSVQSLVIQDTVHTISSDTSYDTGNQTHYVEFAVTPTIGVSIDFNSAGAGSSGNFTITSSFNEVISNTQNVYVALYKNGITYVAQSGTVYVQGSGSLATVEFCKILFKESAGGEHTVSMKSYLN
ncbi:MAG TPA: hypothetical protein PLU10_03735 [Chitinophagaceae bacterium]|nr:hypothetical protein [Chitinophagaceae bacterium]